jgi:hypothetical protein
MDVIWDKKDPSGFGMFSKAGRQTGQRYAIIRQKDEILTNERKVKHVSIFTSFKVTVSLT